MGETIEKVQPIDKLSYIENEAIQLINNSMQKSPKKTVDLINKMLVQINKLPSKPKINTVKMKLQEKKDVIEKQLNTQQYLQNIATTIDMFTDRPKKIPYGNAPGKLVCDQFIKAVVKTIEPDKNNKLLIDTIHGTKVMFDKIQPNKKLVFDGKKLAKLPPVGSIVFFINNKSCDHVGFFVGIKNGVPIIADATNGGVTKRQFGPREADQFYYEENYREKFLPKKVMQPKNTKEKTI